MADPEQAIKVLVQLRALGMSVSIDDFGSGHASMAYPTKLPASELKIDRSFVTGMCQSPREEAIVRSTVDLAGHLNLHVVAEGIETPDVWERLAELGCDTAQGYLLSPPLPPDEFTAWLRNPGEQQTSQESSTLLPLGLSTYHEDPKPTTPWP